MTKNSKKSIKKNELSHVLPKEYPTILEVVVNKVKVAQTRAMLAVNRQLIEVYREIGRIIYEQQEKLNWGTSVVEQLARARPTKIFPRYERVFYSQSLENERFLLILLW